MLILLLAVFGALGTLSRYGLQGWVQGWFSATFPVGTLAINLLGCLLVGALNRVALEHLWFPADWRIALTIGFLGAFTTFSTFSYETARLLEDGQWALAAGYVGLSMIGGLLAVAAGMRLAELF